MSLNDTTPATAPFPQTLPRGHDDGPAQARGGDGFAAALAAYRELSDELAGSTPPTEELAQVTELLRRATALARAHTAPEHLRWDGVRGDLPGRGLLVMPPYVVDEFTPGHLVGRVTFGRAHLGGGGAAHGGTQPLLFDDLLGMAANRGFDAIARTAYLHMEYRAVTPLDVELGFEARLTSQQGRKRLTSGRITGPDGAVLCEASALFVELRPGQP